jgi:hypothetical protein
VGCLRYRDRLEMNRNLRRGAFASQWQQVPRLFRTGFVGPGSYICQSRVLRMMDIDFLFSMTPLRHYTHDLVLVGYEVSRASTP